MTSVRIGNGCGFWGDNLDAPILLAQHGNLRYLTLDYLAELTMSILALQKQKDPQTGFAGDFLDVLQRLGPILHSQPGLKIITNAGGMNPASCARRAQDVLQKQGLSRKIGVVDGDDLLPRLDEILAAGEPLANLDTGEPLSSVRKCVVSANAYLGAGPVVEALMLGADIVITGRVADASLTVAPAVFECGWGWQDWDRLASATVAGHLIECGAQASGGLWCNWQEAVNLGDVGYPFVDVEPDGSFVISKPPGSGGAVNLETVSEQLLYEVADPAAYFTPDVVADFTSVQLSQPGQDTVHVSPGRGRPATDTYKVSIAYRAGYGASGTLVLLGPDATAKAKLCGDMIFRRLERAGVVFQRKNIELLGSGACAPGVFSRPDRRSAGLSDPIEVVLRVSVQDSRKEAVERFSKELAPLVTSGTPGVTGYTTGRPTVREVFAYWPALVKKHLVASRVSLLS
jgi:hypothetical protein